MTVPVSSAMTAGDGSSTADGTDAAGGDGISLEINDGSESSTFSALGGQEGQYLLPIDCVTPVRDAIAMTSYQH